ncbi:MAG: TIGR04282 family arsenosugar biosynthesis glycosyltransferase [Desulfotignum sp.]|nr:TIGR04282 family arsenosugar biosynthesis glycosyltransferase [Desulfobacteraceae bacterium]
MHDRTVIVVMVKYPQAGTVKTRLGRQIGMENASMLYRGFVRTLLVTCRSTGFDTVISCHPDHPVSDYREWLGCGCDFMVQKGSDLGHKMRNAFEQGFSRGFDRVILTGSDLPHLPVSTIEEAAQRTNVCDVVIGPALDGGYYLVAMKQDRFFPEMFGDIPWSTPDVLRLTLEKIEAGRRKFCLLTAMRDIDTREDLNAVSVETGLFFNYLNDESIQGSL